MPVSYFVDPSGLVVELPSEQAKAAAEAGYTPASPEQAAEFVRKDALAKEFGTGPQALMAGAEAFGRAATFGLSTGVQRALGADPARIAAREEVNPTEAAIGTIGGVGVPLLLTGGASAAAGGARGALAGIAELSGPALAAKAGQAVTGAAAKVLPAGASAAGRIASKAIGAGAGAAAEGALYGVGEVVDEAALGNPHLTAESALSTIGLSALLGAGVGGVAGATGDVLGALSGKAKSSDVVGKVADWLGEVEATRAIKAAGGIQSDIARAEKQIGRERLESVAREMFDLKLVGPFTTPAKTAERAHALQEKAGEVIGATLREADAKVAPEALPQIVDIMGRVRADVLRPLTEDPLQADAARRLAEVIEGWELRYTPGMRIEDLHAVRKNVDRAIYGMRGNKDPFAAPLSDALHDVRGILSDEIDGAIERAGLSVKDWKVAKRQYEVASRALEFATKGMQRAEGNNLISLTEWMGALGGGVAGGPLGGLATGAATAAARRHGAGVLGSLAGTARDFLTGEARVVDNLIPPGGGGAARDAASGVVRASRPGEVRIVTPQRPAGEVARYDLVEVEDLVASHNPRSFAPRRDYPTGVQEREYHLSAEEQAKVMRGGDRLNPALVLADTPTAVDGPPLVTSGARRLVLGGNGRSMMIQRAFEDPKARELYRQALAERAPAFGLDAARVAKMRAPVLVRVVDGVPSTASKADLAAAVRRYNEGLTQQLSPRAQAVSEARLLKPSTVESIGGLFADAGDKSLRDIMRAKPLDFVSILQRDGVITDANRSRYLLGETLTEEAKDRIEGMFLGRVVGTGERFNVTAPGTLQKVERITPHLLRVQGINPALDEVATVQAALDLLNGAAKRGMTVDQFLGQGSLFGKVAKPDAATLAIVDLLQRENSIALGQRFARWARDAAVDPRQTLMFAKPPTLTSARRSLFDGLGLSDDALAVKVAPPVEAAPQGTPTGTGAMPEPPPAPPAPPPETAAAVEVVREASAKAQARLEKGAAALLDASHTAARIARAELLAGGAALARESQIGKYERIIKRLTILAQNPEVLADTLAAATADLEDHAPTAARSLQVATVRGVSFLAAKAPQPPDLPALSPLRKAWRPSSTQLATFGRYVEAVDDPIGATLGNALAGTLTPEGVEAVREVYPELFSAIQNTVIEALAGTNGDVPAKSRLMVSMLLGSDVSGGLESFAANQAALRGPSKAPSQQVPNAAPSRADRLTVAERSATDAQRRDGV